MMAIENKISGTEYHHKLIFYSSCNVPRRVLGGAKKVEQGTIRVGGEQLLVITRALIETTVTQRASICHYRWYMFIFHWIIWSSIHLRCPRFVNSYPGLHITVLMITNALTEITLTKRAMNLVYYLNTIIKYYWKKLKQEKILTMMNMWKNKITKMLIVMNLILMPINNSYYMCLIFFGKILKGLL